MVVSMQCNREPFGVSPPAQGTEGMETVLQPEPFQVNWNPYGRKTAWDKPRDRVGTRPSQANEEQTVADQSRVVWGMGTKVNHDWIGTIGTFRWKIQDSSVVA